MKLHAGVPQGAWARRPSAASSRYDAACRPPISYVLMGASRSKGGRIRTPENFFDMGLLQAPLSVLLGGNLSLTRFNHLCNASLQISRQSNARPQWHARRAAISTTVSSMQPMPGGRAWKRPHKAHQEITLPTLVLRVRHIFAGFLQLLHTLGQVGACYIHDMVLNLCHGQR